MERNMTDEVDEGASTTTATGGGGGAAGNNNSGSQHYSLRWNNHQHHLLNAFESLLQNESLVDCTIMCEDAGLRAHRVVLSACSPYFQKIFIENPGKHPVIVLKDVYCWEMQSILDFMYKGETSVPEAQLTSLIKTAESLKIRGLTSSDQLPHGTSLSSSPTNLSTGYRGYSPSPSPHHHHRYSDSSKVTHLSSSGGLRSTESSPLSLTHVDQLSDRASGRASPVPGSAASNCPRRKQARPRRRSGDSINSSLDLSKPGSPPLSYTGGPGGVGRDGPGSGGKHSDSPPSMVGGGMDDHTGPENLSIRRSNSPPSALHHPPAINLVKMEQLVDTDNRRMDTESLSDSKDDLKHYSDSRSSLENGIKHVQEQEALQALNFMASGGSMPGHMIPPGGHPALHPGMSQHPFPPLPVSKGSHGSSSGSQYGGHRSKGQHSAPRGGPPRSWTNDDLTKALEMVWNKRMTTSQASRVFGIPYNSLLMYVRGKYGKSLRLDVLKKNTPAANDNLNTIGNSRSTPKEKNIKREEAKEKLRKASQDSVNTTTGGAPPPPPPGFPMFPFEPPGVNPFNPGLLPFSPLGEPMGLFGLPNAEFRIKDLMASMQTLHNQNMLAEGEKLKANLLSASAGQIGGGGAPGSITGINNKDDPSKDIPMGLASLLIKAKEIQDQGQDPVAAGDEGKSSSSGSGSGGSSGSAKSGSSIAASAGEDMETDADNIPQVAIKPLESGTAGSAASSAMDIKIPATSTEISAQ